MPRGQHTTRRKGDFKILQFSNTMNYTQKPFLPQVYGQKKVCEWPRDVWGTAYRAGKTWHSRRFFGQWTLSGRQ